MEPDTIRRLLETSARYFGLDGAARAAAELDRRAGIGDADDEPASTPVPLACLLSASGCVRPHAMA
ncbi:hypothetical protein [Thauera sp. 2A1]|uniref:hypothetical protein n=1 Tax=Thauera sp. 2A1 TaxID=2570191 RepID=UPI001290A981|nr:hypothetical protein [Thauera sp. 2A1]KAI5914507.1 hypothetical protein GH664_12640 [Thauera sp. 2A1]